MWFPETGTWAHWISALRMFLTIGENHFIRLPGPHCRTCDLFPTCRGGARRRVSEGLEGSRFRSCSAEGFPRQSASFRAGRLRRGDDTCCEPRNEM